MAPLNTSPQAYYAEGFPEYVAEAARELLLARDRYVAAWLAWQDTPLGATCYPRDESETLEAILEAALKCAKVK